MASEQTLFDLFGELTAAWPSAVRRTTGIQAPGSEDPELPVWLAALSNGVRIVRSRMGAEGDHVSIEAELQFDNLRAAYAGKPERFPFVLASMPDVEFRIHTVAAPHVMRLFVAVTEGATDLVIEGLPVEILLPVGFVVPPETGPSEVIVGQFAPGNLDALEIDYRRFLPTSVHVHVRVVMTPDNEFIIRPVVPINLAACVFADLPVRAVHDLTFIPSPHRARNDIDWIRHTIEPWLALDSVPVDGVFAVRSIDLDDTTGFVKDFVDVFGRNGVRLDDAEFVLEDLVVPFFSPYVLPVPRHATVGIRRRVIDATDFGQVFDFAQAPVRITFNSAPDLGLIVNSLFYRSRPKEDLSSDLGVTFSAVIVLEDDESTEHGFEISLGENYTPLLGYRRDFNPTTGLPEPGPSSSVNELFHFTIFDIDIDLMGFRIGYSIGRALGEGRDFEDCFELTGDLLVATTPTGEDQSVFRLRALDGQPVQFAIEGLGWKQGLFQGRLALPDGVAAFFGPVKLVIEAFGIEAEFGASYLSVSGGLGVDAPAGFSGDVRVRRLRFRIAGDDKAPFLQLEGVFVTLKFGCSGGDPAQAKCVLNLEAGGFYSETEPVPGTVLREFGLTGSLEFEIAHVPYKFGLDLLAGDVTTGTDRFRFFLIQVVFSGVVTVAWFELRGARVLFVRNMQPKLQPADVEAHELRYYNWYLATNPVNVPGDRRLAAWQPRDGSWALGIGASASFAQIGRILELTAFVLVVSGDDESGVLIAAEARLLQNPKPIAFAAIQWDGKNDRFSMVIGVSLTPRDFLREAPAWINQIGRITGTIFIANRPEVVAFGRLSDTRTWPGLTFEASLWGGVAVRFGFCIEYSEAPGGGKGFGLFVRLEGTIAARKLLRAEFNAGYSLVIATFTTGSNDYAASFLIEAALRFVLFKFLRVGVAARAEFRTVGEDPARAELRLELRLETPWFLPDVTWTFEVSAGELDPAGLATAVTPLRSAMAIDGARQQGQTVHVERVDPLWKGEGVARTWSVKELRTMVLDEADRLARFAANADARPIATDSSITVEFSVPVNDEIGIGGAVPRLGNQTSDDLRLRYDLIGLAVRRRTRFGADTEWRTLQSRTALTLVFTADGLPDLSGSFVPQQLTMFWAPDVQVGGKTAPKKLLLNSATPYDAQIANPEIDEELVRDNISWPCCPASSPGAAHQLQFRSELLGAEIIERSYSTSESRFRLLRPTHAFAIDFPTNLPLLTTVALVLGLSPGIAFRVDFDEDVAVYAIRLRWSTTKLLLRLVAFDDVGRQVASHDVVAQELFQEIFVQLTGPARRIEAHLIGPKASLSLAGAANLEVPVLWLDVSGYLTTQDHLRMLAIRDACSLQGDSFEDSYSGRAALSLLPNHEYEVSLTTRITVVHPTRPAESVDAKEYVYLRTKGLPGLNAVETVGDEVRQYVRTVYTGGRGALYREEPVAIVFNENFHAAIPLAHRPTGTSEERDLLLAMMLVVRPQTAATGDTAFTTTTEDWIVAHRPVSIAAADAPFRAVLSEGQTVPAPMRSIDPFRARLATITQRASQECPLPDPMSIVATALVAPPQGESDPEDPAKPLWPARLAFNAMVKRDGAAFVDRPSFAPIDLSAFDLATETGIGDAEAWSVADGAILTAAGTTRRFAIFGEASWNHLKIEVAIQDPGAMAGIGVALPGGQTPTQGLFAVVQPSETGRDIAILRTTDGQFDELARAAILDPARDRAPIILSVSAFDDILRVSVGNTVIEATRAELRDGRSCLLAQGACRFASLRVEGLDIYGFSFQTSRYRSFSDHIASFAEPIDTIRPNGLGGTTATSVEALYAATASEIAQAMLPSADPSARQRLFERWSQELCLPLKQDVNRLEISRFVDTGQTRLFLLETPEPLDFAAEIVLALARREQGSGVRRGQAIAGVPGTREIGRGDTRREVERLLGLTTSTSVSSRLPPIEVSAFGDVLEITIAASSFVERARRVKSISIVEAAHNGREKTLRIYGATMVSHGPSRARASSNRRLRLRAVLTDEILLTSGKSALVPPSLAQLPTGLFAWTSADLQEVIAAFGPASEWTSLTVTVLQDRSAHRALIVPIATTAPLPLFAGSYRFQFALDRPRWDHTDQPGHVNRYIASAMLQFEVTDVVDVVGVQS